MATEDWRPERSQTSPKRSNCALEPDLKSHKIDSSLVFKIL